VKTKSDVNTVLQFVTNI